MQLKTISITSANTGMGVRDQLSKTQSGKIYSENQKPNAMERSKLCDRCGAAGPCRWNKKSLYDQASSCPYSIIL